MFGIRFINYSVMQLGSTLEKLSKEYTRKGFSFTYVPLWGSLQSAKGKGTEQNSLPKPVLSKPSPQEFMNDPIHANVEGFNILLSNLYTTYFKKFLVQSV